MFYFVTLVFLIFQPFFWKHFVPTYLSNVPFLQGQGACSFVQPIDSTNDFLDDTLLDAALDLLEDQLVEATNDIWDGSPSSPPSSLTSCGDTSPSSRDMVEEGNSSHQGMEIESPVVDTPEHSQKLGTSFELSRPERVSLVDSQDQEDMPEEPLRRNCKRLRHGDPKVDSLVIDSTSDCWDMPQSKSTSLTTEKGLRPCILTSGALIRQRQVEFLRQISSAGASLPGGVSCLCFMVLFCSVLYMATCFFGTSPRSCI